MTKADALCDSTSLRRFGSASRLESSHLDPCDVGIAVEHRELFQRQQPVIVEA